MDYWKVSLFSQCCSNVSNTNLNPCHRYPILFSLPLFIWIPQKNLLELHIIIMTVKEQLSWYIDENIERFTDLSPEEALNDKDFPNSNKMKGKNLHVFPHTSDQTSSSSFPSSFLSPSSPRFLFFFVSSAAWMLLLYCDHVLLHYYALFCFLLLLPLLCLLFYGVILMFF